MFINVEKCFKHASAHAIRATHFSHKLGFHLEVMCSTPHSTAVIIAPNLAYKLNTHHTESQYTHAKSDHLN